MKEKLTQKDRVLKYIEDFGSISSLEAFKELGNTRLSASIWLLRHEDEIEIDSITESQKNRYGETTYFSRYYLRGSEFERELIRKGIIEDEELKEENRTNDNGNQR